MTFERKQRPQRAVESLRCVDGPMAGHVENTAFACGVGVVVIKHGADGCWLHSYRVAEGDTLRHDTSTCIRAGAI